MLWAHGITSFYFMLAMKVLNGCVEALSSDQAGTVSRNSRNQTWESCTVQFSSAVPWLFAEWWNNQTDIDGWTLRFTILKSFYLLQGIRNIREYFVTDSWNVKFKFVCSKDGTFLSCLFDVFPVSPDSHGLWSHGRTSRVDEQTTKTKTIVLNEAFFNDTSSKSRQFAMDSKE